MISELLDSRGVDYDDTLPELASPARPRRPRRRACSRRYPIELSGGQKQRVVMVLSTLLDPSLLIADELTSALDVSTQRAVAEMLVEFRDRGFVKSTIVITHDLSILYQIADTILIMYAGKLVEKGPTDEIVANPLHPYTQAPDRLAPRGRRPLRGAAADGHPGSPAVAPRPDLGMPLSRPVPARVREVRRGAAVRRGRTRGDLPPAGRWAPDARARRRDEGLQDRDVRRHAARRGVERQLHDRPRRDRLADRRERQRQDARSAG